MVTIRRLSIFLNILGIQPLTWCDKTRLKNPETFRQLLVLVLPADKTLSRCRVRAVRLDIWLVLGENLLGFVPGRKGGGKRAQVDVEVEQLLGDE